MRCGVFDPDKDRAMRRAGGRFAGASPSINVRRGCLGLSGFVQVIAAAGWARCF